MHTVMVICVSGDDLPLAAGKAGCRDQTLLRPENNANKAPAAHSPPGQTGERDWLHANAVSYDPVRDQVVLSLNVPGEIIIVDHGTTMVGGCIRWCHPSCCVLIDSLS